MRHLLVDRLQVLERRAQGLVALGEVQARVAVLGLLEEARARYRAHAHQARHILAEGQVALVAEFGDVDHHVVGALRHAVGKADLVEPLAEQVALGRVELAQLIVVRIRKAQRHRHGLLQRSRRPHRQEIVHLLDALGYLGRGDRVAQAPSGDGIGLGKRAAADGPLEHPRQAGDVGVPIRLVDDVLVHLVGDHVGVILPGELRDELQLLAREHLAAGVRGIAEDECLGVVLGKGALELGTIEIVGGRHERHVDGIGAGKDGVGTVVLVERTEDDHLVAGVGDGHHGRHHRLG